MNEVKVFDNLKVKEEKGQILFDAETAAIKIGISLNKKASNTFVGNAFVNI